MFSIKKTKRCDARCAPPSSLTPLTLSMRCRYGLRFITDLIRPPESYLFCHYFTFCSSSDEIWMRVCERNTRAYTTRSCADAWHLMVVANECHQIAFFIIYLRLSCHWIVYKTVRICCGKWILSKISHGANNRLEFLLRFPVLRFVFARITRARDPRCLP